MPVKTSITISVILTVILIIVIAILSMLGQILLLNGVMDKTQGYTALGIGLGCNGVTILLAGIFVRWLTKFLLVKVNGSPFLSVASSVFVSVGLGMFLSFFSIIVGTLVAGIK